MDDKLSMSLDALVSESRKTFKKDRPHKKKSDKKAPAKASKSSSNVPAKAKPNREMQLKQPTAQQVARSEPRTFASDSVLSRLGAKQDGTAVIITNLGYNISIGDVKELCATIGEIGKVFVKNGTADVYFRYLADATAGIKKYNKVTLDGRPMYWALKDEIKSNPKALTGGTSVFSRDGPVRRDGVMGSTFRPSREMDAAPRGGDTVFSVTMSGVAPQVGVGRGEREKKKPALKAKPKAKKEKEPKQKKEKAPVATRDGLDDDMDGYFAARAAKEE